MRASLVAVQLMGIAMLRHVLRIDPLARASPDKIVILVTPAIDQYLRSPCRIWPGQCHGSISSSDGRRAVA